MKGISRAESKRSTGWLVRAYREGRTYSKFFSFQKYGGERLSLKVAQAYLHAFERSFPPIDKPPYRTTPLRRSKTGVNGVCFTHHRSRRTGEKLLCYSVHYRLSGQIYNKRFYLHLYTSDSAAFEDAVQFRRAMEKLMYQEWLQRKQTPTRKGAPARRSPAPVSAGRA